MSSIEPLSNVHINLKEESHLALARHWSSHLTAAWRIHTISTLDHHKHHEGAIGHIHHLVSHGTGPFLESGRNLWSLNPLSLGFTDSLWNSPSGLGIIFSVVPASWQPGCLPWILGNVPFFLPWPSPALLLLAWRTFLFPPMWRPPVQGVIEYCACLRCWQIPLDVLNQVSAPHSSSTCYLLYWHEAHCFQFLPIFAKCPGIQTDLFRRTVCGTY